MDLAGGDVIFHCLAAPGGGRVLYLYGGYIGCGEGIHGGFGLQRETIYLFGGKSTMCIFFMTDRPARRIWERM